MKLTDELRSEYEKRFHDLPTVGPARIAAASEIAKIIRGRARYEKVAEETGVPWHVIGILHVMECSSDFSCHLANGDPLDRRTVNVPKGRPVTGAPPFTWEESAKDALIYDGFCDWKDWSIGGTLYRFEGWNGWGYRSKGRVSPYIYSMTPYYVSGKYVRDGVYDPAAVSKQVGVLAIFRRLFDSGLVEVP